MDSESKKSKNDDIEYAPEERDAVGIDIDKKSVNNKDGNVDADSDVVPVPEEELKTDAVKRLREKLAVCVKEKQDYLDKWQRSVAEFKNARKRDAEDNELIRKFAAENLMTELLPVLESFNMAFGNKAAWENVDKNWRTGVEYIANQLKSVMEGNGLQEINPLGLKFDPAVHEATNFKEVADESDNHKIIEVLQKGYSFHGRVLKAPKVVAAETRTNAERTQTDAEK